MNSSLRLDRLACLACVAIVASACGAPIVSDASVDGSASDAVDHPGDAGSSDTPDATDAQMPAGPALYPSDRSLSPITPAIAARLRDVASRGSTGQENVFAKVGDSQTVSTYFVHCFAGTHVDLAGRTGLQPTIDHFLAGDAAGSNPYVRTSLAATIGWSAWSALAGDPSPLTQEIDAIRPRYAVIMFGTNDIQSRDIYRYAGNLLDIADQLLAAGVVPLFTSVPPRDDDPTADLWVPRYSAVVRAVAQARQVPFLDLERELRMIPGHGVGPDGIHLESYSTSAGVLPCVFTPDGLQHGANIRNLLTIQSLDRAHVLVSDTTATAPDATAASLAGTGTASDPIVIESMPVTDSRDTSRGGTRAIASYPGCASMADESGPEFVYRFVATRAMHVRAMVFNRGTVDTDIHLLGPSVSGASCIARNDRVLVVDLVPGTYHFVIDTYASGGVEHAGEYVFVAIEE